MNKNRSEENNMHQRFHNIQALKSYRATLIPDNADAASLEGLADAGLLPTIRIKAANAVHALTQAHIASGKGVLRVERVESLIV